MLLEDFFSGGFLDGLVGIQVCMLMAFFYSFSKQARLWEMQTAAALEDRELADDVQPYLLEFPHAAMRIGRIPAGHPSVPEHSDLGVRARWAS